MYALILNGSTPYESCTTIILGASEDKAYLLGLANQINAKITELEKGKLRFDISKHLMEYLEDIGIDAPWLCEEEYSTDVQELKILK